MANFPTNPSIGDLFETKHDTFKWNGSAWEALGRILTHRQKSGTPYSSLSIKESGGVLDTDDTSTVLLVGEQTTEGQVKAAHSSDANTVFLSGETVATGISEFSSDGSTVFLSGETEESGISEFSNDGNTLFLSGEGATAGIEANTADVATPALVTGERDASLYKMRAGLSNTATMREGYRFAHEDWISTPSSSDFAFGTGDFTVEFWMWNEDVSNTTQKGLMQISDAAGGIKTSYNTGFVLSTGANIGDGGIRLHDGSQTVGSSSGVCKENVWQHIAVSRTSGVAKIFVDGKEVASGSFTTDIVGTNLGIGMYYGYNQGGYDYGMLGYMKDIRISKGIGRYTADFTTEITTKDSYHKLILEGGNDISDSGHTVTFNNSAHPVSKTGNKAWHKYGSTDKGYLRTYESVALDGDFTIEWWYLAKATGTQHMFTIGDSKESNGLEFYQGGDGQKLYSNSGYIWTGAGFVSTNTWYHFAVVRSSGVVKVYRDGTQIGSDWSTNTTFTGPIGVGVEYYGGTGYCNGAEAYMDDFTVSKTAKYTGAFTPSTTAAPIDGLNTLFKATTDYDTSDKMQDIIGFHGDATTVEKGYYFDDSSYISIPDSSDFDLSGGESFCIEFWMNTKNFSSPQAGYTYMCTQSWSNNGFEIGHYSDGRIVIFIGSGSWQLNGSNQGSATMQSGTTMSTDTWNHVALTYNGTSYALYLNGVQEDTHTGAAPSYAAGSAELTFGSARESDTNYTYNGYLADIRISKGDIRYSSSFSSPITTKDSNHKLILDGNETDSSDSSHSLSFNSGALATTKRGDRSLYFDGNGDYVQLPSSSDFLAGTGALTAECWINTTRTTRSRVLSHYGASGTNKGWYLDVNNNVVRFFAGDGSSWILADGSTTINDGEWHHLAVVLTGTTYNVYVDGTSEANGNYNININPESDLSFRIGNAHNMDWNQHFSGFINDVRLSRTARYTSNFNVESGTGLSDKSSNSHSMTASGDAAVSTTQKKFGTHSMYFDGTGDFVDFADSSDWSFGTSNFTIEAWIYPTDSTNGGSMIVNNWDWSGAKRSWGLQLVSTGKLRGYISDNGTSNTGSGNAYYLEGNAVTEDAWQHVAFVRNGTNLYLFQDGVLTDSTTIPASFSLYDNNKARAGMGVSGDESYQGYIDDLRISDTARYSSNFYIDAGTYPSDQSSNSYSVSSFGAAATSTTQKKFGTHALYFNGTDSDYMTIPQAAGTFAGDFTVECWVYMESGGSNYSDFISKQGASGQTGWTIGRGYTNNKKLFFNVAGSTWDPILSDELELNRWYHVAGVRESGTNKFFIDGTLIGTNTHSYTEVDVAVAIGNDAGTSGWGRAFKGYLDDIRISNTARYSSSFHVDAGTYISDQSSNSLSVTASGNAALNTAEKKFGTHSIYFDGTGDYISVADHDDFTFGTSSFTIEFWMNRTDTNGNQGILLKGNRSSGNTGIAWLLGNDNFGWFYYGNGSIAYKDFTSVNCPSNVWQHVAMVYDGTDLKLYVNGTLSETHTVAIDIGDTSQSLEIGNSTNYSGGVFLNNNFYFKGYLDEFRISDTARYTSSFLLEDAKTPTDKKGTHTLTLNGDALIASSGSSEETKFGTGAMKFDGNGDYISIPDHSSLDLGSGDFTIECWIKPQNIGSYNRHFFSKAYLSAQGGSHVYNDRSFSGHILTDGKAGFVWYYGESNGSVNGTTVLSNNTWYHYAVVKTGGTISLYIDGNLEASTSDSNTINTTTAELHVGSAFWSTNAGGNWDNGYQGCMDEFRISTSARYTGTFTPQLAEHDLVDTKGWGSPVLGSGERALFVNKNGFIMKSSDGTVTRLDTSSISGGQLTEGSAPASNSKATLYVKSGEDSNTKFLMVGDQIGDNMGTHTVANQAGVAVDSSVKHFGDSSINFTQGDTFIKLDDHEDFHIGTSDFTLETWFRGKSGNSDGINPIFYMYGGSTADRFQFYTQNGKFLFFYSESGTTQIGMRTPDSSYADENWYHIVLTRVSGTWKIYLNGVDQTLTFWEGNATSAPNIQNFPANKGPYIGYSWSGSSYYAHCNMQNFRFSKVARYTSNFTPSTDSFDATGGLFYRDPSGVKTKIS